MQFVPLWDSIIDNVKLHRLGPEVIGKWALLLVCAQRHDCYEGTLPDMETLSFWLRRPEEEIRDWLGQLTQAKLLDKKGKAWAIHDWHEWRCTKDPKARIRMQKMRERNKKREPEDGESHEPTNGVARHVTPPVTPTVAPAFRESLRAGVTACYGVELEVSSEQSSQADACEQKSPPPEIHSTESKAAQKVRDDAVRRWEAIDIDAEIQANELIRTWGAPLAAHGLDKAFRKFGSREKPWAYANTICQGGLPLKGSGGLKVHDPGPTNQPVSAQNLPEGLEQFTERANRSRALYKAQGMDV